MLKEFRVKNFRSFNDEFIFRFDSIRDYGFNTECIKNELINKAVIYGENNSGKSNLGFAIMDISSHLFDRMVPAPYDDGTFLNLNSTENEASFTYIFKFDEDIIEYSYRKNGDKSLAFEQIKVNDKLVFQYNYLEKRILNYLEGTDTLQFSNNLPSGSIIKFIYNNSALPSTSPVKRIVEFASNMLWFRSVRNFEFAAANIGPELLGAFIIEQGLVGELQSFFQKNGIYYQLKGETILNRKVIMVQYGTGSAPLTEVASTGTMSLWLFFYWIHKNNNISFLFIDEFDAFYHYELSKSILNLIIQNRDFQAVVTTHNTFLIDNAIMRPDCYFILKNNKITSFADSTKKTLREGHNLEKMMISGEFNG